MLVSSAEGYRLWAGLYDNAPNALLALEMRVLSERLGELRGRRVLDAGSGTGRWMTWAEARGARVFGIDSCREMLLEAERKPAIRGRCVLAGIGSIPFVDAAADVAICSFTLSYLPSIRTAFRELARVAGRVIVSDLHPCANRHGWTRSFRAEDRIYELEHYEHPVTELDGCAREAGLSPEWRIEASFGEPEREIFQQAGKEAAFAEACRVPAVLISAWHKQSSFPETQRTTDTLRATAAEKFSFP